MKAVVQRVTQAAVFVNEQEIASIGKGYLIFLGFGREDTAGMVGTRLWIKMIDKFTGLRLFPDNEGKMNLSIEDVQGEMLIVSQFTLYADYAKGKRPGFQSAAKPNTAEYLYDHFVSDLKKRYNRVKNGVFGADMDVHLTNWGPVTLLLDTQAL